MEIRGQGVLVLVLGLVVLCYYITMTNERSWATPAFRYAIVKKIDEAIRQSRISTPRNSSEMESHVFEKAKTKEEYLVYVARIILHIREISTTKKCNEIIPAEEQDGPGMEDPINALQNLAL